VDEVGEGCGVFDEGIVEVLESHGRGGLIGGVGVVKL
jgi:hypothetical protein